jgi:hypothetical protein
MSDTPQAYPLSWPFGWKRNVNRQRARFGQKDYSSSWSSTKALTVATARSRLQQELERLGARNPVLSTNVELRLDGQPRSDRSPPADPGVAIYFDYKGKPMVLACDKWDRVPDNINALAKHIEAMRGMDRWGVGTLEQAFTGYRALPAPDPWWKRLGLSGPTRSREEINAAYRKASSAAHPDRPGGSHDRMSDVNAARDEGLKLLTA